MFHKHRDSIFAVPKIPGFSSIGWVILSRPCFDFQFSISHCIPNPFKAPVIAISLTLWKAHSMFTKFARVHSFYGRRSSKTFPVCMYACWAMDRTSSPRVWCICWSISLWIVFNKKEKRLIGLQYLGKELLPACVIEQFPLHLQEGIYLICPMYAEVVEATSRAIISLRGRTFYYLTATTILLINLLR